jgi:hypothetical protein
MIFQNIDMFVQLLKVSQPERPHSKQIPPSELRFLMLSKIYTGSVSNRFEKIYFNGKYDGSRLTRALFFYREIELKVKVTLRLTVSQSVCLGVVPHLGHMTSNLFVILILRKLQSCLCGRPL